MSRSAKRTIFGIYSASFYTKVGGSRKPLGQIEVLGDGKFSMKGTLVELRGGASLVPFAVEQGATSTDITLTMKEYPDFMYYVCTGKTPIVTPSSANGIISDLANGKGTSVFNLTNGLSDVQVAATFEANLKFGKYVIVATDTNKAKIYVMSDSDFARGASVELLDDANLVVDETLYVAANNSFDDLGLKIVGEGVLNFTVGDTAYFEVVPAEAELSEVVIGGKNDVVPEVGVILITQPRSDGSQFEIDCPKCNFSGLELGGAEKAFTETPVVGKASYDSTIGGVAKIRMIKF